MKRGFPQKIEPLLPQSLGKEALDALMELAAATSAGRSPSADLLAQIRCLRPEDIASVVEQAGGEAWVKRYLMPLLTSPECQRRLQTSAAVVGLALSMGASDILSLMRSQALAAEASTAELAKSQRADELAAELNRLAESASSAIEQGSLGSTDSFSPAVVSVRSDSEPQQLTSSQREGAPSDASSYHIVQPGETVFSLARSYGVSPAQIVSLNRLDNASGIKAGQTLQVPSNASLAAEPGAIASLTQERGNRLNLSDQNEAQLSQLRPYQIRPGDTLDSIARSHHLTRAEIVALNQLDNPNDLKVNQVIALPRAAVSPSNGSAELSAQARTVSTASSLQTSSRSEAVLPKEASLPEPPLAVSAVRSGGTSAPSGKKQGPSLSVEASTYRVQQGDTLAKISRKTGTSLAELSRLNGIRNPDFIFVGQSLKLPSTAQTPSKQRVETAPPVVANQPVDSGSGSSRYVDNLLAEIRQMRRQIRGESEVAQQDLPQPLVPDLAKQPQPSSQSVSEAQTPSRPTPSAQRPSKYLEGLKAELQELQGRDRRVADRPAAPSGSQPTAQASNPDGSQSINVELPPVAGAQPQAAPQPQVVAAAPLGSQSYEPLAQSLLSRSVSPELPPLLSEPFMPDGALNGYIWPAEGVFTSGFGWRWGRMHKGIDIAGPVGTPIVAAANGVVTFSGWSDGGYGNLVEVTHSDGSVSLYAHNSRNLVREGQRVRQGQQIAEMGSTGFSTGPHLHFEIHLVGQGAVNPTSLLPNDN